MASISGTIYEESYLVDFIACAYDAESYALAGSVDVSNNAFTISGLVSGKSYVVVVKPKTGSIWTPSTIKSQNDYIFPTNPEGVPSIVYGQDIVNGDGNFDKVDFLVHFEGANNSTIFTDVKGNTITTWGTAKVSTANSRFGNSAAYFDGSVGHFSVTKGFDWFWTWNSQDLTFECWAYPTAYGGYLWSNPGSADESGGWYWRFYINSSGYLGYYSYPGTNFSQEASSYPLQLNSWNHVAFTASGGVIRIYSNGKLVLTGTTGRYPASYYAPITMGSYFTGYLDEYRVTKNLLRYTEEFTPPTEPFLDFQGKFTGSVEPTWPTNAGEVVVDGDITWINRGRIVQPVVHGPLVAS